MPPKPQAEHHAPTMHSPTTAERAHCCLDDSPRDKVVAVTTYREDGDPRHEIPKSKYAISSTFTTGPTTLPLATSFQVGSFECPLGVDWQYSHFDSIPGSPFLLNPQWNLTKPALRSRIANLALEGEHTEAAVGRRGIHGIPRHLSAGPRI